MAVKPFGDPPEAPKPNVAPDLGDVAVLPLPKEKVFEGVAELEVAGVALAGGPPKENPEKGFEAELATAFAPPSALSLASVGRVST